MPMVPYWSTWIQSLASATTASFPAVPVLGGSRSWMEYPDAATHVGGLCWVLSSQPWPLCGHWRSELAEESSLSLFLAQVSFPLTNNTLDISKEGRIKIWRRCRVCMCSLEFKVRISVLSLFWLCYYEMSSFFCWNKVTAAHEMAKFKVAEMRTFKIILIVLH